MWQNWIPYNFFQTIIVCAYRRLRNRFPYKKTARSKVENGFQLSLKI